MISEIDIILRLLAGAFLGALIGFERERQNQPAGLRTHIILVLGSSLAMSLSINLAMQFRSLVPNGDPARLAAQVISGIGFLGAGAIMRYGPNIKGLTTATSLWTMAIVGLAVGGGHYIVAGAATLILFITLNLINIIEKRFIHPSAFSHDIVLTFDERIGLLDELKNTLKLHCKDFNMTSVEKNVRRHRVKVEVYVKLNIPEGLEILMTDLGKIPGIRAFKIS